MYTSDDLIWVKNVKRNRGRDWAYMEHHIGDNFNLDWAPGRNNLGRKDASKARINQLILIFQTIKNVPGSVNGTYLTHIVTPITKNVIPGTNPQYPFSRLVAVIAKNVSPIPKPESLNFKKPNRGWLCDIDLIEPSRNYTQLTREEKQSLIWSLFIAPDSVAKEILERIETEVDSKIYDEAIEGQESYRLARHKYYERDVKIITSAKKLAAKEKRLFCEVCSFDFSKKYSSHGDGFIECHHKTPIATGGIRTTTIKDLALVCSNCHRMLHKKNHCCPVKIQNYFRGYVSC